MPSGLCPHTIISRGLSTLLATLGLLKKPTRTHKVKSTTMTETEPTVVVKQKLLGVQEVFVYRIPPLKSVGGHR